MKLLPLLLCLPPLVSARFCNITTIAGNGLIQFNGGGQAVNTVPIVPAAVAVDVSGNSCVSDTYFNQVFRVAPAGAAPCFVAGVLPVDMQIPAGVIGSVPLQLTVGGVSTAASTVPVK